MEIEFLTSMRAVFTFTSHISPLFCEPIETPKDISVDDLNH
jgi:hypothetical protein